MTPAEQFLTMRVVRTRVEVDARGELVRVETRRCDRTGLVLTRAAVLPPSEEYLRAAR